MKIEFEKVWVFQVRDNYSAPSDWQMAAENAGNPADYMRVHVQYRYGLYIYFIGGLFPPNQRVAMEAEDTYRNELF